MAVPKGYEAVVAFKLCPPGGILLQLGIYIFDMANDVVQVGTFVHHGDFWFAGFMVVFVGLCLLCTNFMVSEQSPLKRCDLVGEAKLCLARQVPTQAWQGMLGAERNIEAPGTGLIGPYGSSLIALTPLQTASALYGLYSSAKAMAEGRLDFEAGGGGNAQSYSLKAVRPMQATLLSVWYCGAFVAELAAFAVVSATLHPFVTLPAYMLGAAANGAAVWWDGGDHHQILQATIASVLSLAMAMAGGQTSALLKRGGFRGPGFIPAVFILIRFWSWAALCCMDLPQGLLPIGSLGRPMGLQILQAKFLEPAAASSDALRCFTSHTWVATETRRNSTVTSFSTEVGFHACSWPATGELSTASTIFNSCLLFLAVVFVPLHICIVLAMLVLNPIYACGAENLGLIEEVEAKQIEIDVFGQQNEEMSGEYMLCTLSDMANDVLQILTFVVHGDYWFAGFMFVFIGLTSLRTVGDSRKLSTLKRFDLLGEAKLCLARKVPTPAWAFMLTSERMIEAPGTGLIGPYGASLIALTPLQAASALYGLVSSAKAMAEGRLDFEAVGAADASPSFALRAVRPVKAALLTVWYFAAFAAELAAFAVVSATLHPLVTLPAYFLGAMMNAVAHHSSEGRMGTLQLFVQSCMAVSVAMAGAQTAAFFKNVDVGGPGWIPAVFISIRFCTWTALCFLNLPHGLLPVTSLGRPMGFPVLQAKFLKPAAACWEALVCFTSQAWIATETETNSTLMSFTAEVGFGECGWPATDELNTTSTIFNTCLLVLAVVLVTIHMCVVIGMLVVNPVYGCGADDLALKEEVQAKDRELVSFASENERAAGQYTEMSLLAN
ncbi:unnamed protein product [Symbiodinium necroappetens]|uniref:Uncharacterized protein n=1 Tax=Symbiodinium necroappetens TaxID=1628268 RepID=A0A812N223_9DINO|nr:unnamed protein product [Symbiodinium necroappetens]